MDTRTFLKKSATYGLGNMLLQVSGFILLPIYARALSPADFGTLEILNRVGEILMVCLLFGGIRQAVLAFYNQGRDERERRKVVGTSMSLIGLLAATACIAIAAGAGPLSHMLRAGTPALFELAILASALDMFTLIPLALCQARLEAGTFVLVTSSQVLVKVGLAIVLVVHLGLGILGVLLASAITAGTYGLALTARECARSRPRPDAATAREMVHFAWPFLLSGLCGFLLNFGDRFFLLRYADAAALGLYAIGYRLAMIVGTFSRAPLQMVWNAQMYEAARREDAPALFGRMFSRILALYLFIGLGVCMLQDEVILVLCGRPYAAAAPIIAPVVLAYFFQAAADLMDAGLFVSRRTGRKAVIAMASAVVMTGLYAALIPSYGAMGAALATLGGFVFHAVATYWITRGVFPVIYQARLLAGMLASAIALWAVSRSLPPGGWAVPIRLGLWACWPAALWIGGLLTPAEKHRVRAIIRSAFERPRRTAVVGAVEDLL